VQWTDKQGNFWIYGGEGDSAGHITILSALWEFNPLANTWTWVKGPKTSYQSPVYGTQGIPSINNTPGARIFGYPTWTDTTGDLWLFGGWTYNNGFGLLNDLWKYHIATNEWTWMGGPSVPNQPGVAGNLYQASSSFIPPPRDEANAGWTDANNNLWLFGGDSAIGFFSDMWRYNISTAEWAWMGGNLGVTESNLGSYGTLGVESAANKPPARSSYTHWIENNYLYFTSGTDSSYAFSDVWRFNLNTNYFTWVGGGQGSVPQGQYTQYCTVTPGDMPRGRFEERTAQLPGCSPLLFMWGGRDVNYNYLNDLWNFDTQSRQWRWVSGSGNINPTGNYGALGVSSPGNMPPGNGGICFWSDNSGNLWLWGGSGQAGFINAMWEYIPDPGCFPVDTGSANLSYQLSSSSLCQGDSAMISFIGDSGVSISPASHVTWIDSLHAVIVPDTSTLFTASGYSPCGLYGSQVFTINIITLPDTVTSNKSIICPGDTAVVCASPGYSVYNWNTGDTGVCINALNAGNYYVTVTGSGNCLSVSNHISIRVYPSLPVSVSVIGDTLAGYGALSYQWLLNHVIITGATDSVYIAKISGSYILQITDSNGCIENSSPVVITGIAGAVLQNNITVFPNPSNTGWKISVSGELLGSLAEVYDGTGRLVFKTTITNMQSAINIPGLASGIYELIVSQPRIGYSAVRKLVKM
jgi:hypothetical protein